MSALLMTQAHAMHLPLVDQSVHCCVTSPPYWGLRDYNVADQLGLEPLHDCHGAFTGVACGDCFICHMRAVFAEAWRVLRDDGTCWVNIGDTMAAGKAGRTDTTSALRQGRMPAGPVLPRRAPHGLKPKDLCGMPWRLAFALQADGWYLRSEIIWHKPNPMPESVTDRPTKAHEQVFLFSKSPRYFFDQVAIAEPSGSIQPSMSRIVQGTNGSHQSIILGKDFRLQETSPTHNTRTPSSVVGYRRLLNICIGLSSAILNCAQLQNKFSLALFQAEIRQQCPEDADCILISGTPEIDRAAMFSSRFLNAAMAPKDFMAELHGLGITLREDNIFRIEGSMPFIFDAPGINGDTNTAIRVNNASEIREGQFEIFHNQEYIASTHTSSTQTRNARTVWTLPSEPTPEAHFATFPSALPRRCILAGTSAHGCCAACGAPWRREVEKESGYRTKHDWRDRWPETTPGHNTKQREGSWVHTNTLGFAPTCSCAAPVRPCTVLDPFAGSGTTLLVARELGRHAVGCDLSWPYLHTIARKRLGLAALAAWEGRSTQTPALTYDALPLFGGQA